MTEFEIAKSFMDARAVRSETVATQERWTAFKAASTLRQWIYLYHFGASKNLDIIAWGTSTNSSDRIRKASIFDPKLTGKYDRRLDYL